MKKIILLLIVMFIIPLFVSSCVPSKPNYEKKVLPADRLLKRIEGNRRKIKYFNGTGRLDIKTKEIENTARFEIFIHKPDSIKLSIYGPFGIDVAQALVTKDDFIFHDVLNDIVYTGEISKDVLYKIFKINLSFDDLIDAFAGAVNLTPRLLDEPSIYDITEDNYFLTYNEKDYSYRYTIDLIDNSIKEYRVIKPDNQVFIQSKYSDFKKMEDVQIPHNIVIKNFIDEQTINIEYRKIKINEAERNLKITYPKDVRVIRL